MLNNKFTAIIILTVFLAALAVGAGSALAQGGLPQAPEVYTGKVYVGGIQAGDGLIVTASMTGWNSSEGTVTEAGQYWLGISPPASVSGIITFYVNGVQAETHVFTAGGGSTPYTYLDLHIAALPTPTTTPVPTSTPVPTPTPTPITSNASTSIGPSGGMVNTSDGTIRITFPAGAFNSSTNVSIQGGACQHGATADFVVGSTCFNVTPDGYLDKLATICVNLSAYDFSIVTNTADLTLGYWSNGNWNTAVNVVRNGTTLCGQTAHLSSWAVLGSTATPSASPTPATTSQSTPASSSTNTPGPTHTQRPPKDAEDGSGTSWPLIGGIVGGAILLAAIVTALNRSFRGGKDKGQKKGKPEQRSGKNGKEEPWDFK